MKRLISLVLLIVVIISCTENTYIKKHKNEIKHFMKSQELYLDANREMREVTSGDHVVGTISEQDRKNYIDKLSHSLTEAKLVSYNTLYSIHPDLPQAYNSIFIPYLVNQIKVWNEMEYNPKLSYEAILLHNKWIDWWNDHYKKFKTY